MLESLQGRALVEMARIHRMCQRSRWATNCRSAGLPQGRMGEGLEQNLHPATDDLLCYTGFGAMMVPPHLCLGVRGDPSMDTLNRGNYS